MTVRMTEVAETGDTNLRGHVCPRHRCWHATRYLTLPVFSLSVEVSAFRTALRGRLDLINVCAYIHTSIYEV